jgi:general L-amino acid transport system substrate-binding protein
MRLIGICAGLAALFTVSAAASAATLDTIKGRQALICGVSQGAPGFSTVNDKGEWGGMDVDFCRALAAATMGDPAKVKFTPLSSKERFTSIQSGDVDILARNTTWTMSRDGGGIGLSFIGVLYYDGQGFMVKKRLAVDSATKLDGAGVCTNAGTTTELNIADFFRARSQKYDMVTFEKSDEAVAAYVADRCDVYSTDLSGLYGYRLRLANPDDHVILPEVISKEPLGPAVRQGDEQWFKIARWVLFALINAEELGVTSKNVDQMKNSPNPEIKRLLGVEGDFGEKLGMPKDWSYQAIKAVGNYGEMFDRNLGEGGPLKIRRGLNNLWNKGGILYAPPVR